MKLNILVLLSLMTCHQVASQVDSNQDYLTQLILDVSEARIPNYLVGVIYNRPVEKSISSQAVLNLYQANNISYASTQNILQLLNVTHSQVFSINNFNYTMQLFNWTFTNFYNTVTNRLNLAGVPLRNALQTLSIDVNQFSAGITWGDPDPWQEFIQGNFSQANIEAACTQANITLEALWAGVRDVFINDLITYQIGDFVQLLLNHTITQPRALVIWNAVPITNEHVYSLPLYSNIIGNFSVRLNNETALGVVTSQQEIIIHRSVYELFREERELLNIRAQTLQTRTSLAVNIINDTIYRDLVVLRQNEETAVSNLTVIGITTVNSNLTNCSYVTFQNNNILTVNVPTAIFNNGSYQVPRSVILNVISGSALVCNNTLYGLARGVVGDFIVVDAFSNFVAPATPTPSSADDLSIGSFKLLVNAMSGLFLLTVVNKLFH